MLMYLGRAQGCVPLVAIVAAILSSIHLLLMTLLEIAGDRPVQGKSL
jgi:hypothetical protein